MPLLDHFHPPLSAERHWESFHSSWATRIADALTERWLPPNYIAEENVHLGPSVEIDVATFEGTSTTADGAVATAAKVWAPPAADLVLPAIFPATFEVRILSTDAGPKLVAAIELVSPSNKDRPAERRAFAIKCASYLCQGISVIIVDIVTNRRANFHAEVMRVLEKDAAWPGAEPELYAVAYRPLRRGAKDEIDVWWTPLALGAPLPTLPLGLNAELAVPVDFDATYLEVCQRRRLVRP